MTNTIFIPAISKFDISEKEISEISKKLPKKIAIAYSIQYKNSALKIRNKLKNHVITGFLQVLGCSKPIFSKDTQAVLLISSGRFHAVSLALETNLPIYIYDRKLSRISEKEIEELRKKKKAAYLKFLHAEKIGIIISTKPGQKNLAPALKIKNNLKDKKAYLFIGNEINPKEFENFQISSWLNTACPRLDFDFNVINIRELNKNI
jgi:diphthamide biosynthesis enzyme Dph1/Dph2-like protein